jgi:hypothetical protein
MPRSQRDGSLRPYSRFPKLGPLLFLPSSSSVVLTKLTGPRSRPTTFFSCGARESNPGQELWPLDHRGGHEYNIKNKILLLLAKTAFQIHCLIQNLRRSYLQQRCQGLYETNFPVHNSWYPLANLAGILRKLFTTATVIINSQEI